MSDVEGTPFILLTDAALSCLAQECKISQKHGFSKVEVITQETRRLITVYL